ENRFIPEPYTYYYRGILPPKSEQLIELTLQSGDIRQPETDARSLGVAVDWIQIRPIVLYLRASDELGFAEGWHNEADSDGGWRYMTSPVASIALPDTLPAGSYDVELTIPSWVDESQLKNVQILLNDQPI